MTREIDTFITKIVREILEENVAVFAGAGLSSSAGFVNWKTLVEPLADELGLDIEKEKDFVALAQHYVNYKSNHRHNVTDIILNEFCKEKNPTENHKILARLPIKTYWTTNYDSLIEDALVEEGKIADIKYTKNHLAQTKWKRDVIVYKMHGDKNHPDSAILIKDDYEKYHLQFAPYITALSGDLVSKTFIFMGFSFTDPNLDYVLSRIRIHYEANQREHYYFIKEVSLSDYNGNKCEYEYEKKKQELFILDLKRYNIQPLLIKNYSDITEILKNIERRINNKNIFISGSAQTYLPFGEKKNSEKFISDLSKRLISLDYNIITGFGLGVGSFVISGALEKIYMDEKKVDNKRLLMRPFPQSIVEGDIQKLWKKYREDMISRAGISIFMFGNKEKNGESIEADGVYKEFVIAKEKGNIIVPIGTTGWIAEKIWNEVNQHYKEFYNDKNNELKELFQELNNKNLSIEDLIEAIVEFIKRIEKGR